MNSQKQALQSEKGDYYASGQRKKRQNTAIKNDEPKQNENKFNPSVNLFHGDLMSPFDIDSDNKELIT